MRPLARYLEKRVSEGWDYGEGFVVGKTVERKAAPFLFGKRFLPASAFTDARIHEGQIETVTDTHFRSAYTELRYSSPLILIKETGSLPLAFWSAGFLAYGQRIVGIHAPADQVAELRKLYSTLRRHHKLHQSFCALCGTQAILNKATAIPKQDIDMLPYPESPEDLSLAFWEEVLCDDVVTHMIDYARLGQNSRALAMAPDHCALREYSDMYVRMLGSVYGNLQAGESISLDGLICQPFIFGKDSDLSWFLEGTTGDLRKLIYSDDKHACLRTIRVLRFYSHNVLLLVKPDRLRYWIRSTAIRDADDTLIDLRRQGY